MALLIDTPRYKLRYNSPTFQTHEDLLASETGREWLYVPHDHGSLEAIANQLGLAAREKKTLTYGALVKNVTFCIPSVNGGQPYQPNMDVDGSNMIRKLDLEVVDEFLTYLSLHSFKNANLIASALVTGPAKGKPSAEFLRLARKLRRSTSRVISDTYVWTRELQASFNYFANLK